MADPTPNEVALKSMSSDLSKSLEAVAAAQQAGQLAPGAGGWTPPSWLAWALGGLAAACGGVLALPSLGVSIPPALMVAAAILAPTIGGLGVASAGPRKS